MVIGILCYLQLCIISPLATLDSIGAAYSHYEVDWVGMEAMPGA